MCDTVVSSGKDRSYFAKNSDRDPDEIQYIYISTNPEQEFYSEPFREKINKYANFSFKTLKEAFDQFNNNYTAVISKPVWIWGAEMGVNEYGLAIGNEAVFSREKVDNEALLGMDILRLALHNCRRAAGAVDFIINLIERFDQGGDGGYSGKLKYHNSFLIKDYTEAYILETAAKHWAVKKVTGTTAISNAYTIEGDYDKIDTKSPDIDNFKAYYENKLFTILSRGNYRRDYADRYLKNHPVNLGNIFDLLRSHNDKNNIKRGMKSICMHPGWFFKNRTTASLVVEYFANNRFLIWFTGAPNPCVSIYKPLLVEEGRARFSDKETAYKFCSRWRKISGKLINSPEYFHQEIKGLRDEIEEEIIKKMHQGIRSKNNLQNIQEECYNLLESFIKEIE